ncbi:hypothetical protein H5410_040365 [Solanum commersonii]|uniref:CCHC-type domain-containing protein n=1 Tax=Solanum commersonii TaxID=4109 RepID=A0A9J5XNN3_SOLCO|nr:hypothetical protein H5410_040365 [Solanum commersonii]
MEPPEEKPVWLGMLKTGKVFEPNPDILHEKWTYPDNQTKRKWYVATYTLKERELFRDSWMNDIRRIACEIEFFKWFEMTVVESITPYLEGINIPVAGTVIKASPFKEKSDKAGVLLTSADIDRVVEQNNYSNQILHVISRQIEDTKPTISRRPTHFHLYSLIKCQKDKKEKKSHRKKSQRRDDSTRPKGNKSRSKRPRDAKIDVCWTCSKTGHKANECRSKTKKKKINLLNMDEETRGKLFAILDEPFSESSGTSDKYNDDEDIDLYYKSNASQSGKDCTCTEAFCTCDNTSQSIRVLSDHSKEAPFDVIQHIPDDEGRNHFLLELKTIILNTDKPKSRPIVEPFSMKQIMSCSDSHSKSSISDLRHEVSNLC